MWIKTVSGYANAQYVTRIYKDSYGRTTVKTVDGDYDCIQEDLSPAELVAALEQFILHPWGPVFDPAEPADPPIIRMKQEAEKQKQALTKKHG
jgi:hypothetical protein